MSPFWILLELWMNEVVVLLGAVRHAELTTPIESGWVPALGAPQFWGSPTYANIFWRRMTYHIGRGVFLGSQTRHCILHKCVARFVSDSALAQFLVGSALLCFTYWFPDNLDVTNIASREPAAVNRNSYCLQSSNLRTKRR